MVLDGSQGRDVDINVDSLWLIGPRAKGGKHSNFYHGNFVPQVPNQMIRRYTDEGDVVADLFMGGGTALFECESLKRSYIGFDINPEVISYVKGMMTGNSCIDYFIHDCDATSAAASSLVEANLKALGKRELGLVIAHPPYMDIIRFTERPEDLSSIADVGAFVDKFVEAVGRVYGFLRNRGHLVLVVGDVYKNSEVVPLGFYLMYAIKKNFKFLLKGIVVKDIVGNRAKLGQEGIWRYRALRNGNFLFKHEYVFVFRKEGKP